jgi:hypothetical protein
MSGFKNIKKLWPIDADDMESNFKTILYDDAPYYVNLSR